MASDNAAFDVHQTDPARLSAEVKHDVLAAPLKQISSVGVFHGQHLLMGKRRDNGLWTLPGGHLNQGEDPHVGAARELFEEAGIRSKSFEPIGSARIAGRSGNPIHVHAYKAVVSSRTAHPFNDPDNEVGNWEWVDVSQGLPHEVRSNLHSPRNLVLQKLGLL